MLLSIGMIIKNESQNLHRCLTRLQPILTRINSELIIADTGSSDNSVEIAREFTQNILQITWNNNFSEARNHTVKAAKGEWYMYLDADDFFEDSEDIISFFNSGEYKKYGCATFQIWNYNPDGISYVVQHAIHLVKMTPETKFEKSIHERIICDGPRKDLTSHVRHVGYEKNDKSKFERNIALLRKEYEADPTDASVLMHLINEYKAADKPTELYKYLDEAKRLGFSHVNHPLFHFYFHSLTYCYLMADDETGFNKAISTAEDYIKYRKVESVTSIDMNYYMGYAYLKLRNYAKALESFQECRRLINLSIAGKLGMTEATTLYVSNAGEGGLVKMVILIALCYIGMNDYKNMAEWIKKIEPNGQIYAEEYFSGLLLAAGLSAEQEFAVFQAFVNTERERNDFITHMKSAFNALTNGDLRGYLAAVKEASACDARYDPVIKRQLKLFCG